MDDRPEPKSREDAPTIPLGAGPAEHRFPVRDWDGYELLEYLGSGAMGSVYKAFDRRLQRPVALKFLLGQIPSLIERFQAEARAQARVEHDNLCKIYEVGEVEGRHYIAMQFIDGERLSEAARKMTLAEKVLAVRDIARALHEAHRTGLIHRDVKPANVMVTRSKDGSWKPYVLDFGLAREAHAAGTTMTGAVLGTPSYMPPEQARGEIHKLDRRTDVYALGATLYDMLTDRAPFPGETFNEIFPQVLHDVPSSPRDTHPEIPADIESIVLKCLRKDPAERYDSARAFADDLQRWLDGDPVVARPTNRWYRLRMKARKNRVAVAVAAVAAPLVLAGIGWGGWNQWTSARQQQLAQDFGQRVQKIESMARLSAMAPLHDVRPEREAVRAQMNAIEDAMRRVGKIGRGPGQYALGRGHLALGEVDDAREHLEAAWDADYRPPEVSYALGLVLGRQYQERLQDIATISGADEREERRAAAQKELRDPALEQFRLAESVETESPQYLEALMALYEDRYDEALAKAREAFDGHMWLYEAKRLEGEVLQLMGDDLRNRGEYDAAADRYTGSVAALEEATSVAPSDPGTYTQLAKVALSRMLLEINDLGGEVEPYFGEGVRATEVAATTNPDYSEAYSTRAQIYKSVALYHINLGQDAGTDLDEAIRAGERAAELDPRNAAAHLVVGATYRQMGKDVRRRGEDPRPAFRKAVAAYETAGSLEPNWAFYANLGLLHKDIAVYQAGVGEDPRESFQRSIDGYRRSISLRPSEFSTHYNLGIARRELATYQSENGIDPRRAFSESASAFRDALERSPNHILIVQALASVYNSLALYQLRVGDDPTSDAKRALTTLATAIDANPGSSYLAHLHDGRGIAYTTLLQYELEHGGDPSALAQMASSELDEALAANPDYHHANSNLCDLYRILAEHDLDLGRDPGEWTRRAVDQGERSLAADPTSVFTRGAIVGALNAVALHQLGSGGDITRTVAQMSRYVDAMRSENPNDPDTHRRAANVLLVEALRAGDERSMETLRRASSEIDEAIAQATDRADLRLDRAVLYDHWARMLFDRGVDAKDEIAEGLRSADAAIALNPRLARARLVRGSLLLARASAPGDPAEAAGTLEEARASIGAALTANGHLARTAEPLLARIATLSSASEGA